MAKSNAIIAPVTVVRRELTESEKRLPRWLRGHRYPRFIGDRLEEIYLDGLFSEPESHLVALWDLASAAVAGVLRIRSDGKWGPDDLSPEVFGSHVIGDLRECRDEILKATPPVHLPIVAPRLERFIDATKESLDAFLSEPLDRILCMNPECKAGGRHLLPGPWTAAFQRFSELGQDVGSLIPFLTPPDAASNHSSPAQQMREMVVAAVGSLGGLKSRSTLRPPFVSPDYRTCTLGGKRYGLSKAQTACLRALWTLSEGGKHWVAQESVFELVARRRWASITVKRLSHVFRTGKSGGKPKHHPLWNTVLRADKERPGYFEVVNP